MLSHSIQSPRFLPCGGAFKIEPIITHEELSEMVGATRLRISMFMQRFHNLGLIETNANHFLIIREKKLADYLAQLS
jgi:Crp-like helix-turn-helix domain